MRNFVKTAWRRSLPGLYWALILLVLPNCGFNVHAPSGSGFNLNKGPTPRDSAIFCDIEAVLGRHCATADERLIGIRLDEAAVALNVGKTSNIGLDYSPEALTRCGGLPEAVTFEGQFPEGFPVCLNCGSVIGSTSYPDANAACRAQCYDFFGTRSADGTLLPDVPPDPVVRNFCDARARASTNFPIDSCFTGVCSEAGTLNIDFLDPRRTAEAVTWTDFIGTAAGGAAGNDLSRTTVATGGFTAGAASTQWITRGDAFVEFSTDRTDQAHVLGFSRVAPGCVFPCPDTDPSMNDISFGIALALDGRYYVFENGVAVMGPDTNGSFGSYSASERFRVSVRANGDGTSVVTYSRLGAPCLPGMPCNQVVFHTSAAAGGYPLRVSASLREQGALLADVRIVRIK